MYSTGIGLVLKGFEALEKNEKPELETKSQEETTVEKVKGHSEKTKGRFFESILAKSKNWFAEEE
jgi:cell division protein FtsA